VNGSEAKSSWLAAPYRRPEAGSHIHGAYFTPPAISCTTRNNQPADAAGLSSNSGLACFVTSDVFLESMPQTT